MSGGDALLATAPVTTPEECVEFVNRVGLCSWRHMGSKLPAAFPNLEEATPWQSDDVMLNTWFWKDDLHIAGSLFYGQILGNGITAFVSRELLPALIAAQGDNDPRTLYEQGRLSHTALLLYEHVERAGPTATNALPWPPGSRTPPLVSLQQKYLITKHALTGRTRGTYGYIWGRCEDHFPDAFTAAARLAVPDARQIILERLAAQNVVLTPEAAAKLFRWVPLI